MADANYPIEQNPVYDPNIRALQDTDPARATTVFNPLLGKIINNTHAVKLEQDKLCETVDKLTSEQKEAFIISMEPPRDWRDGEWWYEEIESSAPDPPLEVEVETVPYNETAVFHIEIDDTTETMLNVTDNEGAATEEDLIII